MPPILYSLLLGDPSLPNIFLIPIQVFEHQEVRGGRGKARDKNSRSANRDNFIKKSVNPGFRYWPPGCDDTPDESGPRLKNDKNATIIGLNRRGRARGETRNRFIINIQSAKKSAGFRPGKKIKKNQRKALQDDSVPLIWSQPTRILTSTIL